MSSIESIVKSSWAEILPKPTADNRPEARDKSREPDTSSANKVSEPLKVLVPRPKRNRHHVLLYVFFLQAH